MHFPWCVNIMSNYLEENHLPINSPLLYSFANKKLAVWLALADRLLPLSVLS
jgi:hypothetical protein